MHIKQVIISGFRSFRNQNEIEPFSVGHNVIVGRNGSGKSNFFDAIQFVLLAPKFFNLRQEDRQQLLHEGAGSSVMAAFVEIIFDNSDDRFSTETDEVVLRRTVGLKKDEFFLNKKRIQKSEVISLLETAGFSRSNPYYIVQQGKVANLCTMKDKDRLVLLKEVSGTSVYEERRSESLKILQEASVQQDRINGLLKFIDDRLGELEAEKLELTEYEKLDSLHRALEYSLHDKELVKANQHLEEVEVTRSNTLTEQNDLFTQLSDLQSELQSKDSNYVLVKSQVDRLSEKRSEKMNALNSAIGALSALTVEYSEYIASTGANQQEFEGLKGKLKEIEKKISVTQKRLTAVEPVHAEKLVIFQNANKDYIKSKQRMEQLYSKQGRNKQFHSKKDRDQYLRHQIDIHKSQQVQKTNIIHQFQDDKLKESTKNEKEVNDLSKFQTELNNRAKRKDELSNSIQQNTKQRNTLQDQRKQIWKDQEVVVEELNVVKGKIDQARQQLNASLPKVLAQGLNVVEQIAQEKNLTGYFGPIIDIVTIKNDALHIPVEVAAGNALFHIVVDDDKTASILMLELEKRKAGRLTFLPLQRIKQNYENNAIDYPKHPDVKLLMAVALEYDEKFEAAIRHVFGKKLLTKDLETAAAFSKQYKQNGFDVVSMDGDVVSSKGGFEGGYRDEKTSKVGYVMTVRAEGDKLVTLMEKELVFKNKLESCEAEINTVMRLLQTEESEKNSIQSNYNQLANELSTRQQQLLTFSENQRLKDVEIEKLTEQVQLLTAEIDAFEKEIPTPLANKLTDAEAIELNELVTKERDVLQLKDQSETEFAAVAAELDRLTVDIRDNLMKRKHDLDAEMLQLQNNLKGNKDYDGRVSLLRGQVEQNEKLVAEYQVEMNDIDVALREKKLALTDSDKLSESNRQKERSIEAKILELSHAQDKLLNKRSMYSLTVIEKQNSLRDLIGVSQKELDACKQYNEKQLLSKLKEVNEKFKSYTNVNRKALDQYVSFNQQRDQLLSRKSTVDKDNESIQLLINSLDQQKEEAIMRTFENVREHFAVVFQELVPGGTGELGMVGIGNGSQVTNDDKTTPQDPFEGVSVRVSFVPSGEQYDLQQLSGGQKAVVALALIFAIQRSDPAPFYLFDELDQALDTNYRAAVARLIQKQVASTDAPAQFITTTFRPELVNVAQKCYGIGLQNKVSNIYSLEKSEAQSFVAELMTEEEAVGAVTSMDTYGSQSYPSTSENPSPRVSNIDTNKLKAVQETLLEESEEEDEDREESSDEEEAVSTKKSKRNAKTAKKAQGKTRGATKFR